MKLIKFNLIFVPFLALCLGCIAYITRKKLLDDARQEVIQNARLIMEASLSSRTYTTKQVAPVLQQQGFKLQAALAQIQKTIELLSVAPDSNAAKDLRVRDKQYFMLGQQRLWEAQQPFLQSLKGQPEELADTDFHPQSVPAFAATESFNYLREKFPDYFYKEATLNPSNPRDRATDWEADVVNLFRNGRARDEFVNTRDTATTGTSLFLARPIKVTNVSCLECHSTPDKAPPAMLRLYGPDNGFGWKMNEIIGAQIVSVPMAVPLEMAQTTFQRLALWLAGAFLCILLVANLGAAITARPRRKPDDSIPFQAV
jgi:hypothetical protein